MKTSLVEVGRLPQYRMDTQNDILATYTFSIVKGLWVGRMNVTLTKINEEKTKAIFEIFNATGGSASPAKLSDLQNAFLDTFSKHLSGQIKINVAQGGKGCLLIGIIGVSIPIVYFIFS